MEYSVFDSGQSQEVIELFTRVFSDSEGHGEGKLFGKFVSELIKTDAQDV